MRCPHTYDALVAMYGLPRQRLECAAAPAADGEPATTELAQTEPATTDLALMDYAALRKAAKAAELGTSGSRKVLLKRLLEAQGSGSGSEPGLTQSDSLASSSVDTAAVVDATPLNATRSGRRYEVGQKVRAAVFMAKNDVVVEPGMFGVVTHVPPPSSHRGVVAEVVINGVRFDAWDDMIEPLGVTRLALFCTYVHEKPKKTKKGTPVRKKRPRRSRKRRPARLHRRPHDFTCAYYLCISQMRWDKRRCSRDAVLRGAPATPSMPGAYKRRAAPRTRTTRRSRTWENEDGCY